MNIGQPDVLFSRLCVLCLWCLWLLEVGEVLMLLMTFIDIIFKNSDSENFDFRILLYF